MSTKIDGEINGCTFLWKIVNINHCWFKNHERMESPSFIADALEGTKWLLRLFPAYNENSVLIYLHRTKDCCGPNDIDVNYRFALLDQDGEFLTASSPLNRTFRKGNFSVCKILERENIFVTEREKFPPEDTLTVHCTIWKTEKALVKSQHLSARTVFKVNRRYFVWKIEEFSTLKPGVKNKFKDDLMDFDLVLNEGLDFEKKPIIAGISIDNSVKYFSFKISIIDSDGEKEDWGTHEYFGGDLKKGVLSTLLFTKKVLENKSRYLPNDALTLDCECVYSTGTSLYELSGCGIISPRTTNAVVQKRKEVCKEKEKHQHTLVLANDLKSLYNDGVYSDTELRTSTKSFPAHKLILSARSPVFRKMFSNDMKENNTGHIDITDLYEDTMHRMLLYIYTGSLEDLQFENACKLYVASDKYEIMSLRSRCSSFLKDNLCSTKACDVLALADRHQDEDLKSAVQDFILKHDEVFGLQEWKHLMATNIQLAADVMYRKIYPS